MAAPQKMRAWQYSSNKGGIATNLRINASAAVPTPKGNQLLVRVLAVSLNPVDHKPAETPIYLFAFPKPTTPGLDFAGEVLHAPTGSRFRPGDRVFGTGKNAFAGGMLAEFAVAEPDRVVPLGSLSPAQGAAIPTAGLTAYQSIFARVEPGSRIFINGGSGGTGTWGIQIATALGHSVTVSCSGRNADLCRALGADVIDYTKGTLLQELKTAARSRKFDLVVDNIYANPELFWKAHEYTAAGAPYVLTPFTPSPAFMRHFLPMKLLPRFLGGGRRKLVSFFAQPKLDQLSRIRDWIAENEMKVVFDQVVGFGEAQQAFERMKSGRTVGKIIVEVAGVVQNAAKAG